MKEISDKIGDILLNWGKDDSQNRAFFFVCVEQGIEENKYSISQGMFGKGKNIKAGLTGSMMKNESFRKLLKEALLDYLIESKGGEIIKEILNQKIVENEHNN